MKIVMSLFLVLSLGLSSCCSRCGNNGGDYTAEKTQSKDSPDWIITAKVKETIVMDGYLSTGSKLVSVTTNDGIVTITGNVGSKRDMYRIVKLARKVQGVSKVDNEMTVGY